MRRAAAFIGALLLAVLVPAAPAWAHNRLRASTPADGAVLSSAPAEVRLEFAEKLNPDYTQVIVSDAAKARVAVSDPVVDGPAATVTFTAALADGVYTVAYRVVSADGHPVQGSYTFTFGDPAALPSVQPVAPVGPGLVRPATIIPAVLGLVIVAGLVVFLLRRRAS